MGVNGPPEFQDRTEAGRRLAALLSSYRGPQTLVLGLPRGGVPVAAVVADALGAPLDVAVVRKLGAPQQEELALGAVAEGGALVLNDDLVEDLGVERPVLDALIARKRAEVADRVHRFRGGAPPPSLAGRDVLVVDDGIATGATALAALRWVRGQGPRRLVLAVPVMPAGAATRFKPPADEVIAVLTPQHLRAVGLWYRHFDQTSDDDVVALLRAARGRQGAP